MVKSNTVRVTVEPATITINTPSGPVVAQAPLPSQETPADQYAQAIQGQPGAIPLAKETGTTGHILLGIGDFVPGALQALDSILGVTLESMIGQVVTISGAQADQLLSQYGFGIRPGTYEVSQRSFNY